MSNRIVFENQVAQRIALSDNKHDFSKIFDRRVFNRGSVECIDSGEPVYDENKLLESIFNIKRNEKNQFIFKEGTVSPYQIKDNSYFAEMMEGMADNVIAVIDMDLGGFSKEMIGYLHDTPNPNKKCILYNGPEVKYDPAGKTQEINLFVRKSMRRAGIDIEPSSFNKLKKRIQLSDLSRNMLYIPPKMNCDDAFTSVEQRFFTNRKISIQEKNKKSYSLIEKGKNKYYMFDKSFANRTLNVLDMKSYTKIFEIIKNGIQQGKIDIQAFIREKIQEIIKPTKGSTEHYLAKRLGDAGQAIASKQIQNSILVTHDRVLLSFALFIGVPRIIFTHTKEEDTYPIRIFERTDLLTPEKQKETQFAKIDLLMKTIIEKIKKLNQIIDEEEYDFNEDYENYEKALEEKKAERIEELNGLFEQIIPKIEERKNNEINALYKKIISKVFEVLPLLKVKTSFSFSEEQVNQAEDFMKRVEEDKAQLYGYTMEQLKEYYTTLTTINNKLDQFDKLKILNETLKEMNKKEVNQLQLVKNIRASVRQRLKKIISHEDRTRINSRLETQLQLSMLNEYMYNVLPGGKESVKRFIHVCIENADLLEGGEYVKDKLQRIVSNGVQSGGGLDGRRYMDEMDEWYKLEEYSISFVQKIIPLFTYSDAKFEAFKRNYPQLYTIINNNLYFIALMYSIDIERTDISVVRDIQQRIQRLVFVKGMRMDIVPSRKRIKGTRRVFPRATTDDLKKYSRMGTRKRTRPAETKSELQDIMELEKEHKEELKHITQIKRMLEEELTKKGTRKKTRKPSKKSRRLRTRRGISLKG